MADEEIKAVRAVRHEGDELPRIHNRGDEKQPEPSLEELVSRIPESYKTAEVDWGMPVGREAW